MSNRTAPAGRRPPKRRAYDSEVRARAKRETREALIAAALALFAERGLDAPTIDEICARAGYTRGAFYAHFGDRDALMVEAMKSRRRATLDGLLASLGDALSVPTLLQLLATLVASGAFPPKDAVRAPEMLQACRRSPELGAAHRALLDETTRMIAELVARDQARGALRDDVDPAALAALLVVLEAGVELMADLGWQYDIASAAQAMIDVLSKR